MMTRFGNALKAVHLDLILQHRERARLRDEEGRKRMFDLIDELEWAYPQLKEQYNDTTDDGSVQS